MRAARCRSVYFVCVFRLFLSSHSCSIVFVSVKDGAMRYGEELKKMRPSTPSRCHQSQESIKGYSIHVFLSVEG